MFYRNFTWWLETHIPADFGGEESGTGWLQEWLKTVPCQNQLFYYVGFDRFLARIDPGTFGWLRHAREYCEWRTVYRLTPAEERAENAMLDEQFPGWPKSRYYEQVW